MGKRSHAIAVFFSPNHLWFHVQYLFHSASKFIETWLVCKEVLGLYNAEVRSLYDVSSRRYETIKYNHLFTGFQSKSRETVLVLTCNCFFLNLRDDTSYIGHCTDPGPLYTPTNFRLIRMHYGGDTALETKCDLARKTSIFYAQLSMISLRFSLG